ncbi:PucR family transcriptional regulator [Mycolicibacterium phocaicum]|uniref:PucR family transcriptional regulator n=1 Tax=Mycolicibacterium phocaicum TaxID=319706 RepID=UPI001CFB21B1|nr:helix-turn-helix domain-containing protein [Mycolicibacterium phocaicum]UCZ61393.1 helix-turn-helix domain-containing protein [Mycolicibacterium phocaicum]
MSANPTDPGRMIAARLLPRVSELAHVLVDRIQQNIEVYRSGGLVPEDDLYESCRANLEFRFRHLAHEPMLDLEAPRRTGRRRADQRVPLALVQNAFRNSFECMWQMIVTAAAETESVTDADLVGIAGEVWSFHDTFTGAMMNAFNETVAQLMLRHDQERSALVEAVLQGGMGDAKTVHDAADLLALPYQGTFAVVAADAPGLARHALPNVEPVLRARDIGSAWRLTPDLHLGIVSLRNAAGMTELVDTLRSLATSRVGVSPAFSRLDQTPQALHLARNALGAGRIGVAAVTVFDDSPVPMLVVSAPTTAAAISKQILGPILELSDSDRELLITTMAVYFEVDGSASQAAERLHCHPNTVRYRLRRIEKLAGRSFERKLDSAELYIALNALKQLPTMQAASEEQI